MIRLATKFSRAFKNNGIGPPSSLTRRTLLLPAPKAVVVAPPPIRHFSTVNSSLTVNPVALEMIKYATSVARLQKTEESYARGLLVLEQCESTQPDDTVKGLVELARSTLLFERGSHEAAIETLGKIQDIGLPSIPIKVAASEALVGIYLEQYREDAASVVADLALRLLGTIRTEINDWSGFEVLEARVRALKGLIELIGCNLESAKTYFEGLDGQSCFSGNATLSYGEFLHGMREYSTAKELYQKVIRGMSEIKEFGDPDNLGACNMISEEVAIAASCSLGQLEAHMGNFDEAEEILTASLKKMKERFGSQHPKIGVILTCISLMYRLKATKEHSSSLLIQEGLFRKAIELLKAPPLEADGSSENVLRKDIIALARGGYAEILCIQQSRKAEGERLKRWAEKAWGNQWMSLGDALDLSAASPRVPVIDTRICRAV